MADGNGWRHWDPITAGVVLERLSPTTELAFFADPEVAVARPLVNLLTGQADDPRIPVLELVDTRLARGETDGWHYDDMPEDADAWRQTLQWLDADAHDAHGTGFAQLSSTQQKARIQHVQDLADGGKQWHDYTATRVWSLWTRYTSTAYYSHPDAWDEIGFGGPAYPRGYLNIGIDRAEHWE